MLSSLKRLFILRFFVLLIFGVNIIPTEAYCNLKIALFGDSLMAGYGLDEEYHLATVLEKRLKKKGFKINIINASVSGDTTTGGLNRLNWLLNKRDLDIVIVCLGANDMLRGISPTLVKNNLNKILETLQENNINIVLAGMLSQEIYGKEYKSNFDKIYPELANKFKISFLPFLLEGVALNPEYNLDDGKHPNEKGVKLISINLEKHIIKLLNN